jgi:hypothetical protein
MLRYFSILIVIVLSLNLATAAGTSGDSPATDTGLGYSILRLFLEDEQYLTAIRRAKSVINLDTTSDSVADLVDEIADVSESALADLDNFSEKPPAIRFVPLDRDSIAYSVFDELRFSTAKALLLDGEQFEKNILLSQIQVLPVIAQLAASIAENETSSHRKRWLEQLNKKYSGLYRRASDSLHARK